MHPSALENCRLFFEVYSRQLQCKEKVKVLDIGSQDVNGSLRSVCPDYFDYLGVDFVEGKGVDVVLEDPYKLPFENNSVDIVLSSSCFEHSQMFWILFLEIIRILKPNGLFYLNAPSNGMFHRYPVDCWRFYPDSGNALIEWGKRNGQNITLIESFISLQTGGSEAEYHWNDYVAIFHKFDENPIQFDDLISKRKDTFINGLCKGKTEIVNHSDFSEDFWKLWYIKLIIDNKIPAYSTSSSDVKLSLVSDIINNRIKLKT